MAKKQQRLRHPIVRSSSQPSKPLTDGIQRLSRIKFFPHVLIASAILIAYNNALTGEFVFDDRVTVTENESIRKLWPVHVPLTPPLKASTSGRPIPNLSLAVNYAIGGLNVVGYHLVNIALHVVNSFLVFELLRRTIAATFGTLRSETTTIGLAFSIALLWSLHPIQTETVTYVTQRTELSMAFFLLLTLYAARQAWDAKSPRRQMRWEWVSIISCGLGMASKEVMVVAPVLVVLYDLAFSSQPPKLLWKRRSFLYLGLMLTWLILAALMSTNPRGDTAGFGLAISPWVYMTTQCWAITNYIFLAFWPTDLCGDYGIFTITEPSLWLPSLALIALLLALTLWLWFRARSLSYLGIWFFFILAPTSSFVPIVSEPIAERRMYLPLLSLIAAATIGVISLWPRLTTGSNPTDMSSNFRTGLLAVVLASVACAYVFATQARNRSFKTELAFWTDVVAKRPANARALKTLGMIHLREDRFEQAVSCFDQVNAIEPDDPDIHYNLGVIHTLRGNLEQAIAAYDRAIQVRPNMLEAFFNRGLLRFQLGKHAAAIQDFQTVLELDPMSARARIGMGDTYASQGKISEARTCYESAMKLHPNSPEIESKLKALEKDTDK